MVEGYNHLDEAAVAFKKPIVLALCFANELYDLGIFPFGFGAIYVIKKTRAVFVVALFCLHNMLSDQ